MKHFRLLLRQSLITAKGLDKLSLKGLFQQKLVYDSKREALLKHTSTLNSLYELRTKGAADRESEVSMYLFYRQEEFI